MKKTGEPLESYAEDEQPLVYHYGKPGERLKNADESVRQFYAGEGPQLSKGLFHWLVHTRSSRFMFFTLLAFVALIGVTAVFKQNDAAGSVSGIPVQMTAFSFEDTVYVSIKLPEQTGFDSGSSIVNATVRAYTVEKQLLDSTEISGIYTGKELFLRTTFSDYDILYIEAVVTVSDSAVALQADIIRQ